LDLKSKHVPALDGLRGVAIISVIAHHQLIPLSLTGGFLGVDLFFVLSGCLITSLLIAEFAKRNAISFRNFYMRRVLRLGPALTLYLFACLIVTYYLHPEELSREIKLIGIALAYSTNWRLAFGWDPSMDFTAIIWSLSIEEQFYVIWPLLLFVCLTVKLRRSFIIAGLSVVIVAIMSCRYLLLREGAQLTRLYYGTDTRADALLMGCLIALIPSRKLANRKVINWKCSNLHIRIKVQTCLNVAAVFSALCLLYLASTCSFSDQFLYRGGYTGIAVFSGLLTWNVASGSPRLLATFLEWYPLRWFGKISYGLYLWHWLLLKSTTFYFLVGVWDPWARFVVAVGISALSFYLVERPFKLLKVKFET
jgi:peptidoglycan/LPS O-acetylase OafA/YrhL